MFTWLGMLPLEIKEVTGLIEPTDEVKEEETIVGTVSEELKKIYTLFNTMKKAGEILSVEMKYAKVSDQEKGKYAELMNKARALESIFWIGVHDELKIWGQPGQCAIRVGWQVVEFKNPDLPFPFGIFGHGPWT